MQMYKVFINDKWIFFNENQEAQFADNEEYELLACNYDLIFNLSVMIKTGNYDRNIVLSSSKQIPDSFDYFLKQFTVLEAAGGIVYNTANNYLMIKRFGIYDFPKGKIEKDENKSEAALREVTEETGVEKLKIMEVLPETYHIYRFGKDWLIKKTYWFLMHTQYNGLLIPQTEESIEEVIWVSKKELLHYMANSYGSLKELVNTLISK